ncbi:hypothetical protein ACIQCG_38900 [Streptomyces noursei]|uniref:hypothetical protein n=1 Tax=Streptomyces noursei TaxID=1971 RepID=UPI0035E14F6B
MDVPIYGFGVLGTNLRHTRRSLKLNRGRRLPNRLYRIDGCTTPYVISMLVVGLQRQPCQLPDSPLGFMSCIQQALVSSLSTIAAPPPVLDPQFTKRSAFLCGLLAYLLPFQSLILSPLNPSGHKRRQSAAQQRSDDRDGRGHQGARHREAL